MQVIELEEKDKKIWDYYVYRSIDSSLFQLYGWRKIMEEIFGCKTHYLSCEGGGNVKGILPLYVVKSWIVGNSISSMPGGICADNEEIAKLLFQKAKEIVKKENAKYLLLRDCYRKWDFDLKISTYNTSILSLTKDSNELWKTVDREARRQTRLAMKAGLEATIGQNKLQEFYKVFSINMRDLGTPVFSYKFFKQIISEFSEETNVLTVKYKGKVIGGWLIFFFKDTISALWGSSLRRYFSYCPNNLLYWESFKYGCDNGFKFFDMGRSRKDSSTFKYKEQWGAYSKEIYYQYYQPISHNDRDIVIDRPKYSFVSSIWKKLPVVMTNVLGPSLRKNIPFG